MDGWMAVSKRRWACDLVTAALSGRSLSVKRSGRSVRAEWDRRGLGRISGAAVWLDLGQELCRLFVVVVVEVGRWVGKSCKAVASQSPRRHYRGRWVDR